MCSFFTTVLDSMAVISFEALSLSLVPSPSLCLSIQGDSEFEGVVLEGREGEGPEGGANLLLLGVVAVLAVLVWWTCRRPRKKARLRGRRSLVAKFPVV